MDKTKTTKNDKKRNNDYTDRHTEQTNGQITEHTKKNANDN